MSERDLIKELKATIQDLTADRDDALAKCKAKESRLKQVMLKLEHATGDVKATGHKIGEQNKEIAQLKAKLDTKDRLLEEAMQKIKDIHDDSPQEEDPDTEDKELD